MDKLERYVEEYSTAEDALLAELDRTTNLRMVQPKMVSGRVQGVFLKLIARMLRPECVLEIGTFTGYSALSIASGMDENTRLHTIEIDDELEDFVRSFFARSPHGHKIRLHIGSALEVIPELVRRLEHDGDFGGFDMVFIDGDKREYPAYYRMLMGDETGRPMMRPGGIILADNVLWYGKVAEVDGGQVGGGGEVSEQVSGERLMGGGGKTDKQTAGILEFNRLVAADSRVENVILPLRDGINMIRVK